MKELQLNGLPIECTFAELSTHDFAENGSKFVLKPKADEILEFTGVKMDFDSKINYKTITIKMFAHGMENPVKTVLYEKLKNWKHKSHNTEVDDFTFVNSKIITYDRQFAEHVYLVSESIANYLGNQIKVLGLERLEISVEGDTPLTDISGNEIEMVQGRYDALLYKATQQDKDEWANGI